VKDSGHRGPDKERRKGARDWVAERRAIGRYPKNKTTTVGSPETKKGNNTRAAKRKVEWKHTKGRKFGAQWCSRLWGCKKKRPREDQTEKRKKAGRWETGRVRGWGQGPAIPAPLLVGSSRRKKQNVSIGIESKAPGATDNWMVEKEKPNIVKRRQTKQSKSQEKRGLGGSARPTESQTETPHGKKRE